MDNTKSKKSSKIKELFPVVLLMVLGISLIIFSFKIKNITSKEQILEKALSNSYQTIKSNLIIPKYYKNDNFSLKSDYKLYLEKEFDSIEDKNIFNKLNEADNSLNISLSKDNKSLLIDLKTTKNNNNLINYQNYIKNSTNYIKINEISDKYINLGNNTYFENLSSEDSSLSNLDYILNKVIEYIPISLSKDNITSKNVRELLNKKEKNLYKVSYLVDNHELVKLLNNLKSNLKKDKKSYNILTNYDKNYFNKKIKESDKILSKDEKITINIYTDIMYNIVKYEFEYKNDMKSKIYSLDIDDNNILLTTIEDHKVNNYFNIKKTNNKYIVEVEDSNNKNVGNIEFENNKVGTNLIASFSNSNYKYDLNLDRKITDNNNGYNSVLNINYIRTNINTTEKDYIFRLDSNTVVEKDYKDDIDIKDSILKDSLSKDKKEIIDNYKDYITNKLKS